MFFGGLVGPFTSGPLKDSRHAISFAPFFYGFGISKKSLLSIAGLPGHAGRFLWVLNKIIALYDILWVDLGHPVGVLFLLLQSSDRLYLGPDSGATILALKTALKMALDANLILWHVQTSHFWTFSCERILKPFLKPFLKPKFLHQNRGPDSLPLLLLKASSVWFLSLVDLHTLTRECRYPWGD